MGRKKANDYGCRINNSILRRVVLITPDKKKYTKLVKEKGYSVRYCGREIGLCEVDGIWMAIDLLTGVRIEKCGYKKRGNLVNFLKKKVDKYSRYFLDNESRFQQLEVIFLRLKQLYEYSEKEKVEMRNG